MLERYPEEEDWYRVRFSDEVHFGYGPEGQLRIIRKPGTRYRQDCIQHSDPPAEKDFKRLHAWAAVGWNFKSELIFCNVPTNTNGKMSMEIYINTILDPVVKPWIEQGDDFVMEEDGDSGHGARSKNNPVVKWKKQHGLESYYNCASSPDLSPIENCWQIPKRHISKYLHWDDTTMKDLAREGWAKMSQHFINERIKTMPDRFRAVISGGGVMTGY